MKNILDAVVLKTDNPDEKTLADMRWMSDATGVVYQAQVENLKKLANLVFYPDVAVISIDTDARFVKVESTGPLSEANARYPDMVKAILGAGWTVQLCYNVSNGPAKDRKRNRTDTSRKRRSGTVRKQPRRKRKSRS